MYQFLIICSSLDSTSCWKMIDAIWVVILIPKVSQKKLETRTLVGF